jgi:hypothetical protein
MAIIPGMNPVPTILNVAPPVDDPTDGRISVMTGAALDVVGLTVDDGAPGSPDDCEHPANPHVSPITQTIVRPLKCMERLLSLERERSAKR